MIIFIIIYEIIGVVLLALMDASLKERDMETVSGFLSEKKIIPGLLTIMVLATMSPIMIIIAAIVYFVNKKR